MNLKAITLLALLAALLSLDVLAGNQTASVEKADLNGVVNYSRLSGSTGYAGSSAGFGGATEPQAMQALKDAGYATVINLRGADEKGVDLEASRAAAAAAGIHYVHLPIDGRNPDPDIVDAVLASVGNPDNQPVYMHCGSATRAGALWMIGRVLKDGWDMDAAEAEVESIAGKPGIATAIASSYLAGSPTDPDPEE